jgi:hypothetical protein
VTFRQVSRHLRLAIAVVLLLAVAGMTLSGGVNQLPRARMPGQMVETVVQLACGVLSLSSVLTCFWWHRWGRPIRAAWTVSLVTAASLSALVWGPPSATIAVVFFGVALLLAEAVGWALRTGLAP